MDAVGDDILKLILNPFIALNCFKSPEEGYFVGLVCKKWCCIINTNTYMMSKVFLNCLIKDYTSRVDWLQKHPPLHITWDDLSYYEVRSVHSCQWLRNNTNCSVAHIEPIAHAQEGRWDVAMWLIEAGARMRGDLCDLAAKQGNLILLKWLNRQGCSWDVTACAAAAEKGYLDILQWMRKKGCPWNNETTKVALQNGHFDVLEWAIGQGCPIEENVSNAYKLLLLYKEVTEFEIEGRIWTTKQATEEQENLILWTRNHGIPFQFSDWNLVLWLVTKLGASWNVITCAELFKHHGLETVKIARSLGCPLGDDVLMQALQFEDPEPAIWAAGEGCACFSSCLPDAIKTENYYIMEGLVISGCPLSWYLWDVATERKSLKLLLWLKEKMPGEYLNFIIALYNSGFLNSTQTVHWLKDNGLTWSPLLCRYAAYDQNWNMVKYLHENGCPWDVGTFYWIAKFGNLDFLKEAINDGLVWGEIGFITNREVIKWIKENRPKDAIDLLKRNGKYYSGLTTCTIKPIHLLPKLTTQLRTTVRIEVEETSATITLVLNCDNIPRNYFNNFFNLKVAEIPVCNNVN